MLLRHVWLALLWPEQIKIGQTGHAQGHFSEGAVIILTFSIVCPAALWWLYILKTDNCQRIILFGAME